MFDVKEFSTRILDAVKSYVSSAVDPVREELTQVEKDIQEDLDKLSSQTSQDLAEVKDLASSWGPALEEVVNTLRQETVDQVTTLDGSIQSVREEVAAAVEAIDKSAELIEEIKQEAQSLASKLDTLDEMISTSVSDVASSELEAMRESVKAMFDRVDAKIKELTDIELKDGAPGRDGKDGRDGAPGRDALTFDVLSSIDESKSYPARTYATHNGGMWVARRQTSGMDGWDCIVNGLSELSFEQSEEDERQFKATCKLTDGRSVEKTVTVSSMIYRGVFSKDSNYTKGDCVTWGGSVWCAQEDTTGRPGEGDTGWRLAVKQGEAYRPAKDGVKHAPVKFRENK